MRSDKNVKKLKSEGGALGNFGETTPRNSFSGGERDNLFVSDGGDQYYDIAGVSGLDDPGDGRTSSLLDFDRDGWQDFVVASATEPTIQLYRNRIGDVQGGAPGNVLAFRFAGGNRAGTVSPEWSNREGIGAKLRVQLGDRTLLREVRRGDGRATANSATLLVGLDTAAQADRVEVTWPSGRVQELVGVQSGTLVTFHENPDELGGDVAALEPYRRDVRLGEGRHDAERPTLDIARPATDAAPRLNLYVAMFTTCASCKKQMPSVEHLRSSLADENVAIWGVPVKLEETAEELHAYVEAHQPAYDVLADLPMEQRETVKAVIEAEWNDLVTPSTIVTDAGGTVLGMMQGVPTLSEIRKLLPE